MCAPAAAATRLGTTARLTMTGPCATDCTCASAAASARPAPHRGPCLPVLRGQPDPRPCFQDTGFPEGQGVPCVSEPWLRQRCARASTAASRSPASAIARRCDSQRIALRISRAGTGAIWRGAAQLRLLAPSHRRASRRVLYDSPKRDHPTWSIREAPHFAVTSCVASPSARPGGERCSGSAALLVSAAVVAGCGGSDARGQLRSAAQLGCVGGRFSSRSPLGTRGRG
jgi:hypothetical protein